MTGQKPVPSGTETDHNPDQANDIHPLYQDENPNVSQSRASNPQSSVWVGASAGTGKTKVLTDRVLRLLLPQKDGKPGAEPHRILGITFTKAAANEMALRINDILGKWTVISDEDLRKTLKDLIGFDPNDEILKQARTLFARVVDTPGGLKIMTIHSFCQSVLSRFPLEAQISPHFTVIEEGQAFEYLAQARDTVLKKARLDPDSYIAKAITLIAGEINETQFMDLLTDVVKERTALSKVTENLQTLNTELSALCGIKEALDLDSLKTEFCKDRAFEKNTLISAADILSHSNKTDKERSEKIQDFLNADEISRAKLMSRYQSGFLTNEGQTRAKLCAKTISDKHPHIADALQKEAERVYAYIQTRKAVQMRDWTRALLTLGRAIVDAYTSIKNRSAALDYDDLIIKTFELLSQPGISSWVMYKLDGGLDHILIDEAQDTNPEQWQIISQLCSDFFDGEGQRIDDANRTVFVVGDEKQSIYSFQRAAPREFSKMRAFFEQKIENSDKEWTNQSLNTSFRSTKSVLQLVDEVFRTENMRNGLGDDPVRHISHRSNDAGLCELWPLQVSEADTQTESWEPPTQIVESKSAQSKLADQIAGTIQQWIEDKHPLESKNRAIHPGDILILVRTRTAFVAQLVRALKTRNIPVSGLDRMVLNTELCIMDLIAMAQFALLPDDDLTLATVLKSPFIGLTDSDLEDLAIGRDRMSLWASLRTKPAYSEIEAYLKSMINLGSGATPFAFFNYILQTPCPADTISGKRAMLSRLGLDIEDPLDEFIAQCLSYERDKGGSLQQFLIHHRKNTSALKREMEEDSQAVRIMTVHGSKGLQAPIVILPDTVRTPSSKRLSQILWPDKSGLPLPLWCPRTASAPDLYLDARIAVADNLDEEYRRLLYVALTRAEDRLYVCGATGKSKPIDDSWYSYVENAFKRLGDVEQISIENPSIENTPIENTTEPGDSSRAENIPESAPESTPENIHQKSGESAGVADSDHVILRLSNAQTKDPEDKQDKKENTVQNPDIPQYFYETAPDEPDPPRPLAPSRPSDPEAAVQSPLSRDDQYRFLRGNITHSLLQYLPDIAPDRRKDAGRHYIAKAGQELSADIQDSILTEALKILNAPAFAHLFGEGSLAEVPITGLINGNIISAQIDRMIITDTDITIIDFKSNRPPPLKSENVPAIYKSQMKSYRDIVKTLYPDHNIRLYLLWTDGPNLMDVTDIL